ncbi:MAG: hypothetical protein M9958_00425 [Chitinophagales bacterium]|nr:hypothetical protein [Chitinophagales bacterium]
MKNYNKIKEGIKELGGGAQYEILEGKVKAIDIQNLTVDIEIQAGVVIFDVRLRAVISDNTGIYVIPAKDSICTIAKIEMGQDYILIASSQIDKFIIRIQEVTLEVTKDGFAFNDGQLKGLVKITELVQQLNTLENKVNQIVAWTGTHLHSGSGAGTAPPVVGTLTNTTIADLENPKIKQ